MPDSRLTRLLEKSTRTVLGLNSGTSMDAIDAIAVRIHGHGTGLRYEVLGARMSPFPVELRRRLLAAPEIDLPEGLALDRALGHAFAAAATELAESALGGLADVDLIASHGQTIFHGGSLAAGAAPTTLQIGDPDVIAACTGVPVVADFRRADTARGGAGAPLMPYLDWLLFRHAPGTVALNLGGIAALTIVQDRFERCLASDVGPANLPLDALAGRASGGRLTCDVGGALAAAGRVDGALLANLLRHPFLCLPPPRTTGREAFGPAFARELWSSRPDLEPADLLATVTVFVARTVAGAARAWAPAGLEPARAVASGGGIHNPTLMAALQEAFRPIPVQILEEPGLDPDFKESLLFAILGHERLGGPPTTLPGATGARVPAHAGRLAW